MIKWFQLVNEKNELVRRECDFIYMWVSYFVHSEDLLIAVLKDLTLLM